MASSEYTTGETSEYTTEVQASSPPSQSQQLSFYSTDSLDILSIPKTPRIPETPSIPEMPTTNSDSTLTVQFYYLSWVLLFLWTLFGLFILHHNKAESDAIEIHLVTFQQIQYKADFLQLAIMALDTGCFRAGQTYRGTGQWLAPTSGETFDNPDAAFARLQDYAFVMGFAVVKTAGSITTGQMDELIFHEVPRPSVVLSDQAKGLITILPSVWPNIQHQLCEWHIFNNIKKHLLTSQHYNKEQIESLYSLVWIYIQNVNLKDISIHRQELLNAIVLKERQYIWEHMYPKERQFIRAYTRQYRNLGANSTQRNESMHPVIKQFLRPQLNLEQAAAKLVQQLDILARKLDAEEGKNRTHKPYLIDEEPFKDLIGKVTHWALELLEPEYVAFKLAYKLASPALASPALASLALASELPAFEYHCERTLNGEDAERYALLHQRVTQQLQAQFTHERQLGIPREFQPRIPNNYPLPHPVNLGPEDNVDLAPEAFVTSTAPPILQSKKSHGSTRSRVLTGVEVAERFSKRQRKCRVQKAATGNSREMGVEGVPVQETQDIIILNPRSC
ncbi:hypothetical protein L211DRAFT_864253 [Terfezia boudieri ATCC MYA-4762]|uniref:MULE transposase domain-containing protein n=1 Tax=Terfezia boudieri ATCC MYA-4762 TaxID=1051890 RepID=A0A3N4M3C6_9PEZI|nr:hypothetical protein L211DRAFT_864253 [Terfezia boudieri ATCC MYA-4762]